MPSLLLTIVFNETDHMKMDILHAMLLGVSGLISGLISGFISGWSPAVAELTFDWTRMMHD